MLYIIDDVMLVIQDGRSNQIKHTMAEPAMAEPKSKGYQTSAMEFLGGAVTVLER